MKEHVQNFLVNHCSIFNVKKLATVKNKLKSTRRTTSVRKWVQAAVSKLDKFISITNDIT